GRTIQRTAKDEEDQFRQAMSEGTLAPGDTSAAVRDTSINARPIFHTDAGRVVRGGGGIVPDVLVKRDTLSSAEKEFARALGEKAAVYRDVLTAYALELKQKGTIKAENFPVSREMHQAVYDRLKGRGVQVTQAVYDSAGGLVDPQIGYEV